MPAYGYEFYLLVVYSISHSFAALTREISSWPLEDKIHIHARACNILYFFHYLFVAFCYNFIAIPALNYFFRFKFWWLKFRCFLADFGWVSLIWVHATAQVSEDIGPCYFGNEQSFPISNSEELLLLITLSVYHDSDSFPLNIPAGCSWKREPKL